jgi:hypothetical protein
MLFGLIHEVQKMVRKEGKLLIDWRVQTGSLV